MTDIIEDTVSLDIDKFHYENTYKKLCGSESSYDGKKKSVFPTMISLFVWGAILGYINDHPKDIENKQPTSPFKWGYLKSPHNSLLIAFAVQKSKSFDILKTPDLLKDDIEKHSNGGMELIHASMAQDPMAYTSTEALIYEIQRRIAK